jgi:hypothetical protein
MIREVFSGLYQGDIRDLNRAGRERAPFDLFVNVGSTNWLPPDQYAIHYPMIDGPWPGKPSRVKENDWEALVGLAQLIVGNLRNGRKVLVTCDAGLSRSVVMCGMVIAILKSIPMSEDLKTAVRTPTPPSIDLWDEAQRAVAVLRSSVIEPPRLAYSRLV